MKKDILFFFGAGLSCSCGYPDTKLLNEGYSQYIKDIKEHPIHKEYIDIVRKFPKNDEVDIEKYILSYHQSMMQIILKNMLKMK